MSQTSSYSYIFQLLLLPQETTLEPGHETYDQWLNPTVPTYKDYYVYDLVNPEEFANGAKPRFEELGPYRYR